MESPNLGNDISSRFNSGNECSCDDTSSYKDNEVFIAGLFDFQSFELAPTIFNYTIDLLNDHNNGWYDNVFSDGTKIISSVTNALCDAKVAVPEYWRLKTEWGKPLHGVIGCTCSGASKAVARIAGLESIPIISMSSSSAELSDKEEFSSFSRLVGPDNRSGQVGALVSMLEEFNWSRVGILTTDTEYASDMANEFASLWKEKEKEVAYRVTLLRSSGMIDETSLSRAFNSIPTHEPRINSRVIVLFAHYGDAKKILEYASRTEFQTDTIWIGTDAWTGRDVSNGWLSTIPGYIGIIPANNQNGKGHKKFLDALKKKQIANGDKVITKLSAYQYETMVDSIVLLVIALSALEPHERSNGNKVTNVMRSIRLWDGVNGNVSFNKKGDRANPSYQVMNLRSSSSSPDAWKSVGVVTSLGRKDPISIKDVCWPGVCNLDSAPSEKYDIPPEKLATWVIIVISILGLVVVGLFVRYYRSHMKKKRLKANMTEIQKKIDEMKNIDGSLIKVQNQLEEAKKKQRDLILKRANLQDTPDTWVKGSKSVLNEVLQSDDEYWTVHEKMKETMEDAWISKLWRVQNQSLWTYYSFHKDKILMNGDDPQEKLVWHGTSSLDPGIIFNDQQDGFMMQFSRQGFWGRGLYFAKNASYSYSYSHTPQTNCLERLDAESDEKEMYLAKLVVGNEIEMNRDESNHMESQCRALTVPPVIPNTTKRYNTVTGTTGGSQVWIVYENGRAYPDYLIRYYRGERDPKRTPLGSKSGQEMKSSLFRKKPKSKSDLQKSVKSKVVWEYFDNVWKEYSLSVQTEIEAHYQKNAGDVIQVKSGDWTYDVDVRMLFQKNVSHPNHTTRDIRRRVVP